MIWYVFKEGRKTPSGRIRASETTPPEHLAVKARRIVNSPNIEILPTSKRPEAKKFDPFYDGFYRISQAPESQMDQAVA